MNDIREIFAEIVETTIFEDTCKSVGLNDLKCILDIELEGDDLDILKSLFSGLCEEIHRLEGVDREKEEQLCYISGKMLQFDVPIMKSACDVLLFEEIVKDFTNREHLQVTEAIAMPDGSNIWTELNPWY